MTQSHTAVLATWLVALTAAALSGGCADPREEPHLRFCKQLTLTQVAYPETAVWTGYRQQANGYQGLTVQLEFTVGANGQAMTSSCAYSHQAPESTALELADPLAAYAGSPSAMSINGRALSRQALAEAVKVAMLAQGRALLDQTQRTLNNALSR